MARCWAGGRFLAPGHHLHLDRAQRGATFRDDGAQVMAVDAEGWPGGPSRVLGAGGARDEGLCQSGLPAGMDMSSWRGFLARGGSRPGDAGGSRDGYSAAMAKPGEGAATGGA